MKIKYAPVVTKSVSTQIAEQIQLSITDGTLKANDKLPTEEELSQQFQVSRPTVREALKLLAAKNLTRSRRGPTGGTFVNTPNLQEASDFLGSSVALMISLGVFELSEIAEVRHEMELICVRLAVERRTDDQLACMEDEIKLQKDKAISDEEFLGSDVRFHREIVEATKNKVLQFQMYTVLEALQPVENLLLFGLRKREKIIEYHERIISAVRSRDIEKAEAAINDQMNYLREIFAQAQKTLSQSSLERNSG